MRILQNISPSPQQLLIVSRNRPGLEIIRGAAGSGKTTTALLRLKSLIAMFQSSRRRSNDDRPIRILILTFNRTLRGYIKALAEAQIQSQENIVMQISTFAKWAKDSIENFQKAQITIIKGINKRQKIIELAKNIPLEFEFLVDEIDYIFGRFPYANFNDYIQIERTGRGIIPRVEKDIRAQIIKEVIKPYQDWINEKGLWDWHDLANSMINQVQCEPFDIIIADEAQDFSANEVRAIINHFGVDSSHTFILDTTQRIYARGFTWKEVGLTVRPEQSTRLNANFRNTRQIARFAACLLDGVEVDDDGTIPDFKTCKGNGQLPKILIGRYRDQLTWSINNILENIDINEDSVAFLHPKGGGFFDDIRRKLLSQKMEFVEIYRKSEWPKGNENIALCTMHSAKGLEFDHVIAIGLSKTMMEEDIETEDGRINTWRKVLAMALGRAKKTVTIGYKDGEQTRLIDYFKKETYELVKL